jgi:hypothetical protein
MDTLPDELHLMVLSFLDPDEWRVTKYAQYRLVSRRFATISAQVMFESFQFKPSTTAIDSMNKLVAAGLARYVKTLDFDGEVKSERQSSYHTNHYVPVKTEEIHFKIYREIVLGFATAKSPMECICAQHLPSSFFREDNMPAAFTQLKSLDLRIDMDPEDEAHRGLQRLRPFVERLPCLEMMTLAFGEEADWEARRFKLPMLQDIIPLDGFRWTKLRTLCLELLWIREVEVVSLLAAHAATLTCFHFTGFRMMRTKIPTTNDREFQRKWWENERSEWRNIFAQIARMNVLRHATLSSSSPRKAKEEKLWKLKIESDARTIDVTTDLARFLETKELAPVNAQGGRDDDSQDYSDDGTLE